MRYLVNSLFNASVPMARLLAAMLLIISIVFPTALSMVKICILAVVISLTFTAILTRKISWTPRRRAVALAVTFFAFIGYTWCLYGAAQGAPGAIRVMSVYVAYPLLFFVAGSVFKEGDFQRLHSVLKIATWIVLASQALYLVSWVGADGGAFFEFVSTLYPEQAVVDAGEDYLLFALPGAASLLFLSPLLLIDALFTSRSQAQSVLLFLLTLIALMLTGRRAVYVVLAFGVAAGVIASGSLLRSSYIRLRVLARAAFVLSVVLLAGCGAIAAGFVNLEAVGDRISSILDFSTDPDNAIRRTQFEVLIDETNDAPFLGNGAGASASYIRSNSQPWAYELSYVAHLFQFGLLGTLLYGLGALLIIFYLLRMVVNPSLPDTERVCVLAYFAGFIGFLVANATNPYLLKFDYMWVIFIPVAAVAAGVDKIRRACIDSRVPSLAAKL